MKFPVPLDRIASILGCPEHNVAAHWPVIELCLDSLGIYTDRVAIAALATIAVETAHSFQPIKEKGGDDYLNRMYDTRTNLGNTPAQDGDGALYAGRGFVQITGKANYEHYGKLLGIDLVSQPQNAMVPDVAASILAAYFKEHRVHQAANVSDWLQVRKIVNGGTNSLDDFLARVRGLEGALYGKAAGTGH